MERVLRPENKNAILIGHYAGMFYVHIRHYILHMSETKIIYLGMYDIYFILQYLATKSVKVDLMSRGNKVIQAKFGNGYKLIDSFNFFR